MFLLKIGGTGDFFATFSNKECDMICIDMICDIDRKMSRAYSSELARL